ncbi:tryptophan-rich sensory protein [Bradyrhizobium sp. U87765 SZCCT0131]|uniref:TspO/MBR family protein n=1 Tax=unclassified Bradyrhizobium TaxID=2631580 RepID=UPI001BA60E23|nr:MULTISPECIES: TspO/MBR family protein [unclassified Bradyrhizobium]MBR1222966.1 tryptophan-rich sensory protein [Bradyrhizobium sp. U87765 SZCCT0131]MBR1262702.1 tryptophan-rich sensory protein [Bradyrhizobium sp. U87765 SZCCT0134]MBR1308826.1 tryptophan-rich sensory protein [Bradyrhizobium sp. U87765 SZCCT0110]MBR1318484.1 tryptophan-rich sensory protein [Bradyrhizobium sp. U87765 SZCCT0109]MBR1352188.1 tryptophan-rich sensory protein [Bradyrhizobium sp. U87765 SZCCT0048]
MFKSLERLLACLVLCAGIGAFAGWVTQPQIEGWYIGLAKPSWTPPRYLFPIAWAVLYVMMALSLWRLWDRTIPSPARREALIFFFVQLALNALWSPVFFGWHNLHAALAIIIALVVTIIGTIFTSARVDRAAAWLLLPYLVWVSYATALNAGIVAMN